MGLAAALESNLPATVADFRQFYGIDLPIDGGDVPDFERMGLLWEELPAESRSARAMESDLLWSNETWLLWHIEHTARVLAWQRTKDGSRGVNEPRPLPTPSELSRKRDAARRAIDNRRQIDAILGVSDG